MKVDGVAYRTIWLNADDASVDVIDQTRLPHVFAVKTLRCLDDAVEAIRGMVVRGAPLIGATAAYGLALAMAEDASFVYLETACAKLAAARPTAVNLRWALERLSGQLRGAAEGERRAAAYRLAAEVCDEDVRINQAIGMAGAQVIATAWEACGRSRPVAARTPTPSSAARDPRVPRPRPR